MAGIPAASWPSAGEGHLPGPSTVSSRTFTSNQAETGGPSLHLSVLQASHLLNGNSNSTYIVENKMAKSM